MKNRIAGAVASAAVLAAIAGCEFRIDGTVDEDGGRGTLPPVTIPGDEGLGTVFDIVDPDDADLTSEAESGVYVSAGPLEGEAAGSCDFVQTREVEVSEVVRVEIAVSDDALDVDQVNVAEPDAAVVEDDPTTAETDFKVTLEVGDTFASAGCEDWVKIAEADE